MSVQRRHDRRDVANGVSQAVGAHGNENCHEACNADKGTMRGLRRHLVNVGVEVGYVATVADSQPSARSSHRMRIDLGVADGAEVRPLLDRTPVSSNHCRNTWHPAPDPLIDPQHEQMAIVAQPQVSTLVGQNRSALGSRQPNDRFGDHDVAIPARDSESDRLERRRNPHLDTGELIVHNCRRRPRRQ